MYPWIEPGIAQVDEYIHTHKDERIQKHQVLDDDDIALDHGRDHGPPESWYAKGLLNGDRSAQHKSHQNARHGDHGEQGVWQRIAEHHEPFALPSATGNPTSHGMITARIPISALRGPRRRIKSATLSPRKKDAPSLPLARSFIQRKYCWYRGSLRCNSCMILARSASVNLVAPSPYMTASRSPGSKRITIKIMIDTPKTVRTPKAARRIRYLCMLLTPSSASHFPCSNATQGRGTPTLLVQPHSIKTHHVIDAKVVCGIMALDRVVPAIIHPLPRHRE